jgi:hypothetical protein
MIPGASKVGSGLRSVVDDIYDLGSKRSGVLSGFSQEQIDAAGVARNELDRAVFGGVRGTSIQVPKFSQEKFSIASPVAKKDFVKGNVNSWDQVFETGNYPSTYTADLGVRLPSTVKIGSNASGQSLGRQMGKIVDDVDLREQTLNEMSENIAEVFRRGYTNARSQQRSLTPDDYLSQYGDFYDVKGLSGVRGTGIDEPGLLASASSSFAAGKPPAAEVFMLADLLANPYALPRGAFSAPRASALRAATSGQPGSTFHTSISGERMKIPSYGLTESIAALRQISGSTRPMRMVVGDRHATDVAMGVKGAYEGMGKLSNPKLYSMVEDAYLLAAQKLGIKDPEKLQAVTWELFKNFTQKPSSEIPIANLWDEALARIGGARNIDKFWRSPLDVRREMMAEAASAVGGADKETALRLMLQYDDLIRKPAPAISQLRGGSDLLRRTIGDMT